MIKFLKRSVPLYTTLTVLLLITSVLSLRYGSAQMTMGEFLSGFGDSTSANGIILYSIRLPRVLGAILAGVGLSASGVLLQTVTDNPLASPNIIGVNAGAGLAVILCLSFLPANIYLLPIGAFVGALASTLLIVFIANKISSSKITVILSGIAFSAILNAGISFVSLLDTDVLASYNYFSIGGLSGLKLNELVVPAVMIVVALACALALSHRARLLILGDGIASSLGVNVKRIRIICLVLASLLAASVVSFAGLIGFVGLIVPHIARRFTGESLKKLLITSSLVGSILVQVSDLLGRVLFAPSELPVGIIMSLVGAPFFFFLLIKSRRRGGEI